MGNFSISLAQTDSIPHSIPASKNPPDPSNKLPNFMLPPSANAANASYKLTGLLFLGHFRADFVAVAGLFSQVFAPLAVAIFHNFSSLISAIVCAFFLSQRSGSQPRAIPVSPKYWQPLVLACGKFLRKYMQPRQFL